MPDSNVLFGLGLLLIAFTCYRSYNGTYYHGEKLSYLTDTLHVKPSFVKKKLKKKGFYKNYYYIQIQLSYSRSKFIIPDNGYSIIMEDIDKLADLYSLDSGDIVKVGYLQDYEGWTTYSGNEVKAISLETDKFKILSKSEVLKADNFYKMLFSIIGFVFIFLGFVALIFAKNTDK